jgi:probable phosphoglycerate mutase
VTILLVARHGETDWNRDGRWQGHADPPLNDTGRRQAHELAAALRGEPIAAVYASDLRRARETAEIVAADLGLPVTVDERLREVDVGAWSGLTMADLEERFPDSVRRWRGADPAHSFGDGETYAAMGERVVAAVEEIVGRHADERVLVVGHGGPIRSLLAHSAGISYEEQRHRKAHVDNCGVTRFAVEDGALRGID